MVKAIMEKIAQQVEQCRKAVEEGREAIDVITGSGYSLRVIRWMEKDGRERFKILYKFGNTEKEISINKFWEVVTNKVQSELIKRKDVILNEFTYKVEVLHLILASYHLATYLLTALNIQDEARIYLILIAIILTDYLLKTKVPTYVLARSFKIIYVALKNNVELTSDMVILVLELFDPLKN